MFKFLINPSRFNKFADIIFKPLIVITSLCFIIGLSLVYFSPLDYQQGLTVKIMYIPYSISNHSIVFSIDSYNEHKNGAI